MLSLMELPRNAYFKEKLNNKSEIPSNMEIKAKNTCHILQIFFEITKKNYYKKEILPIELFDNSVDEVLSINIRLKNKDENYFNKNNEQIEVKEFYQDIYTLEELKNNVKGFEWFTDLMAFKEAFIKSIKRNNFELFVIKNILLLNMKIINYFGDECICNLIIRPYIGSLSPNNFWNFSSKTKNKNIPKKSYISNNTSSKKEKEKNIINIPLNTTLINKKRLRFRPNKDSPKNKSSISITNYNTNSNSITENEKSQSDHDYLTEYELPNFELDALAKESNIIKENKEEALIGDAITNSAKKYRLLFRASRDGDSANKFHDICDKYSNLIVLIITEDGTRFGGFTSSKFRSSSHLKFDNNAFLFSLDNKKVFNIIPGQYAIYCYDNTGPCFSKGSLYVPNNFFTKYGKTRIAGGPFQFKKDYELNNGIEKFLIKELEIFQVKIEGTNY